MFDLKTIREQINHTGMASNKHMDLLIAGLCSIIYIFFLNKYGFNLGNVYIQMGFILALTGAWKFHLFLKKVIIENNNRKIVVGTGIFFTTLFLISPILLNNPSLDLQQGLIFYDFIIAGFVFSILPCKEFD